MPELIENLCADLRERLVHFPKPTETIFIDKVVELLAWFQHRFVYIHPFQDYNGRLARMLTILLLLKLNLPAVEIQIESKIDREKYLRAMQSGDEGDLSLLAKLISETLAETMTDKSRS